MSFQIFKGFDEKWIELLQNGVMIFKTHFGVLKMQRLFIVISVLITLSSYAETANMTLPIFSQKLELSFPKGFKAGAQNQQGNVFMIEFVPKDEAVENWSQMLTVGGYQNLAANHSAESAQKLEAGSIQVACPKEFVFEKIPYTHPQGYNSSLAIVGCSKHPAMPTKSELALQLVIQGKKDIYQVKKSFRAPVGSKSTLSKTNYKTLAAEVLNTKVCKNDGPGPACQPDPAR